MQTTDTVLMVRPAAFTYDAEAALTNASQHMGSTSTIERIGGGSARCMLAEVFTPKR